MDGGGGSEGGSLDSSARPSATPGRKPWALLSQKSSINPTIPPSFPGCADRPPSHPRGGGAPGREGGMVGLMDDSTPQAPAPIRNHFRCSESSQPWRERSLAQSSGDGSGGGGGVMGVASVSWVVGWALVPCTCPFPRLSTSGIPVAPGAYWTLRWRGGGRGGEDQGIVGPPSTPLPLARPEEIVLRVGG